MATISQINSYIVDIPTIRPHKLSMTSMAVQSMVIVRIRDSEGREGIGEGTTIGGLAYGAESPESIKTNIDSYITPLLKGKGTDNPQVVMQDIHRAIRGNSIAKSAIETALLDLLGKTLNVPLSTLLGGALHSHIPCLWVLASGDTQRDIDEAKTMIATGRHNTFKLKIGNRSVQDDVAHVAAIKSALGNEISIRVDVNQAWTESDANLGMALLQEAGVDIVEQPTSAGQLDSLVRLADKYRIGVMADESISNINDCFELAKRGFSGSVALKIAKAAYGINPIVIDIDDEKLAVAKEIGASEVINSSTEGAAEKLLELTGGGANAIVDFVGAEASVNFGYNLLARGGTYVVVGLFGGQITIPLPMQTILSKNLKGSYVGSYGEMEELMDLVTAGKIEPVEVESRDVSEVNRTLQEMKEGKLQGLVALTHD